jgi:hypothetical protein
MPGQQKRKSTGGYKACASQRFKAVTGDSFHRSTKYLKDCKGGELADIICGLAPHWDYDEVKAKCGKEDLLMLITRAADVDEHMPIDVEKRQAFVVASVPCNTA